MEEAIRIQKWSQIGFQNQPELVVYVICLLRSITYWILPCWKQLLTTKSGYFSYNFRSPVCTSAYPWFSQDVLIILHVFDNRQQRILAAKVLHVDNIFINFPSLCLETQKTTSEGLQMPSQTSCLGLPKHVKWASEIRHRKIPFFAPGPFWEIPSLRAPGPGNGTPVIYRYMYQ